MISRGPLARLWVRLMLAFAGVLLIAVLAPALYARHVARTEFQQFLSRGEQIRRLNLAGAFAYAYRTNQGSWAGAQERAVGFGQLFNTRIVVTNANGIVVADSEGTLLGQRFSGGPDWQQTLITDPPLPRANLTRTTPPPGAILYGTVYLEAPAAVVERDAFLANLQRALVLGAIVGLLAALAISAFLARRIGQPIEQVMTAAHRMGEGDLSQRVPVTGSDEIADLARSFNAMAEKLAISQNLRRQLVADIAHELRTPLANIRGYLEAIDDGVVEPDEATLQTLREEAAQLNHLIDDLQELAQAEAGALRLDRQASDVAELIERVLAATRARAAERGVALQQTLAPDLPPVAIDRQRIAQALANLVNNALTHTPPGGRVTISAARVDERFVAVTVDDSGAGIDAEDLPHIFERFYRADRSRARATGGSGLGLTISRQLIEAHGGTIVASSTPDRGSRFTFTLPVAPAPSTRLATDTHVKENAGPVAYSTSKMTSTSTGALPGSPAIPTAERACRPASPKTSTSSSEKPLIT